MTRCRCLAGLVMLSMAAAGCSPVSAVSWGVKLAGDVVNDADVMDREQRLIGQRPGAADEMFGPRLDTLRDTRSNRAWLVYPVEVDLRHEYRYVVEVTDNQVVALAKTQKDANPELDIPEQLIFEKKVEGKSPAECEASLGLGPPLVTVKSETTGHLSQLYKAQPIEVQGVTQPHYCVPRFDGRDRCAEVELVSAVAQAGAAALGR